MEVADHEVTVAVVLPNFTVLVPCVAPKLVPVMVTEVPGVPEVGLRELIAGADEVPLTVKETPLLATLFTVTVTFEAPAAMLGTLA
jgi:hypothetical protein